MKAERDLRMGKVGKDPGLFSRREPGQEIFLHITQL